MKGELYNTHEGQFISHWEYHPAYENRQYNIFSVALEEFCLVSEKTEMTSASPRSPWAQKIHFITEKIGITISESGVWNMWSFIRQGGSKKETLLNCLADDWIQCFFGAEPILGPKN